MLNNLILVSLLVCFFWAVIYAYSCVKDELSKTKSTKKEDKPKFEMTAQEASQQFNNLTAAGDIDGAQKLAKKYLCYDSEHHELRKKLAHSFMESNKEYEAITHFSVLTQIYPDDLDIFQCLAELYKSTRQTKKAIHYYTYILSKNKDDISAMRQLADLYYQNKQKESALKLYKRLSFATNDEVEKFYVYEIMGSIYSSYGEYEKAIALYEKVLEYNDNNLEVVRDLRRIYLKLKDTQKVITLSKRLIELDSQNYIFYEDLINLLFHIKSFDEALHFATQALNLEDAKIEDVKNIIGKIYIKTGNAQEAITYITDALTEYPTNINLSQTLAMAYCVTEDFEKAKEVCTNAMEVALPSEIKTIRNNISTILSEEAVYFLKQGQNTEAFEKFSEAMKYNNENPEIYFKLANANISIKNFPEAIRQCKRAIDLAPENSHYYEKLGDIYYELQNYIEAKKLYKDTISIDPTNARAHSILGIIQSKNKEHDSAIKSLETAAELDKGNPDIVYNLGLAYEYAGRKEDARLRYEEVLILNPEHKEAANNLKLL